MKGFFAALIGWGREAVWALVAVFLFRWGAMLLGVRAQLDPVIHGLGGMAMAFFLMRGALRMERYLGRLTVSSRYLLIFSLTCTVALFWEFGEWASDGLRGTHIQKDVSETLGDLLSGTVGAVITLGIAALAERRLKPPKNPV